MEVIQFKIRLSYFTYNQNSDISNDTIYIDETDNFDKLYSIKFDYNWLDVASDYSQEEKEYKENSHKLRYGYNDDDVYMDVTYKDGFCYIELIVNTPLNTPVTVYIPNNHHPQLITRTLFDWIKMSINGCLSDGIGENEVAYYGDHDNDVWLSDIITDEPLDNTGCYFYIGDPIKVIENPEEIKKIEYPEYRKLWNDIHEKYSEYYDDNKKLLTHRNNAAIYKECEELNNKAVKYALNKISELYDK